jgi:hypothetical protein
VIKTIAIAVAVFAIAAVGGVLHYTDAEPVVVFVVTGIALGGVAWTIGSRRSPSGRGSARP